MKKTLLTQGFTLIELLVVIAILGILSAVVLVAIDPGQRIAEANDSSAKSQLGQVATALESCYTANQGAYTNCVNASKDTAALVSGGYLKLAAPMVKVDLNGSNAFAYVNMTAKSNITGGASCASGQSSWMLYHTSTGATDTKGAACVSTSTTPTGP